MELEDETERRGLNNQTRNGRSRGEGRVVRPRGVTEETMILPAHKSFNFFFFSLLTTLFTSLPSCSQAAKYQSPTWNVT